MEVERTYALTPYRTNEEDARGAPIHRFGAVCLWGIGSIQRFTGRENAPVGVWRRDGVKELRRDY